VLRAIPTPVGLDPSLRLALLEAVGATDSLGECAQLAADHLHRHARTERVVCAVSSERGGPLVGIAGRGVPPSRIAGLSIDLEAPSHLGGLRALLRDAPRTAQIPELAGVFAEGRCTVTPAPLPLPRAELPLALLFTSVERTATDELIWTAGILGRQLARCRQLAELTQARRRLERERAFTQRILTAFPDPVLLTDLECRLLAANPRAEHYFATQDGESDGRRRAVALNNMLFSAGLSSTAIEGTEAVRRELPLVDPTDGSDRLFELLSTPIATPEGLGIVSVLRNVTDLQLAAHEIAENYRKIRIAEADVRAERDRLDLVIDSVGAPILVTDPNGALALMNAPAERLFTASARAAAEELPRVRANHAHFSSHVSNVFFGPGTSRIRGELGLADPQTGEPAPVEAVSGKVLSEHGEVTAVVSILHDLREAKEKQQLYERLKLASEQLEQKVRDATAELVTQNELLRRQHIELEQASNLKSQFLATMSHEFRTPLNAILGYTSILRENIAGDLNPGQARSVARIDSNAHQLLAIINDILDIARIEAGSMPTHLGTFELPELIAEVLAEVDPLIARSKAAVSSRLARGLPKIRSDRAKVKQILVNLLSNALKFTANGSVTVSCAGEKGARQVTVAVVDTGIGIAEEDLDRIFEDFRQADNSPTRQYGGTGLGLAICRRLARVLGGQVTVESKLGHGSTFRLTLPLRMRAS
jgi:signal transduction histidine kinase